MNSSNHRPHHTLCTSTSVTTVLRSWHSLEDLGAHALAQLTTVQVRCTRAGYPHDGIGCGLALRETLRQALERLRPAAGPEPLKPSKQWFAYLIIKNRYVRQQSPAVIQELLGLPQRTYYHYHKRAIKQMCSILQEVELQTAAVQHQPDP